MRITLCLSGFGFAGALVLAGCGGTSSATFSSDLDAYHPPGGAPPAPTRPIVFTMANPSSIPTDRVVYGADFPPDTSSDFDNLEIVNPSLKQQLAVMRVGSDHTDNNLLTVFAGVKNRSARPLKIEMETIYKDKLGKPLNGGENGWIPMTLKPHEETQYRSIALSEDATDFLVRIRHAEEQTAKP